MDRHKHADLIHEWADGAEIQFKDAYGDWLRAGIWPQWLKDTEYRVKPQSKPDVVIDTFITREANFISSYLVGKANLRYVFDGETGKLKSVEVLK